MSVEIEMVIQFLYQQDKRLKLNVGWKREGGMGRTHKQLALSSVHLPLLEDAEDASQELRDERSECFHGKRGGRCAKLLDNRRANCLLNDSDNVAKFPETIET